MSPSSRISLCCVVALCFTSPVAAESGMRPEPSASHNTDALTGKERLGPKWTDEQRIDNCKVPVDKRGSKPRPSACPHAPTG